MWPLLGRIGLQVATAFGIVHLVEGAVTSVSGGPADPVGGTAALALYKAQAERAKTFAYAAVGVAAVAVLGAGVTVYVTTKRRR